MRKARVSGVTRDSGLFVLGSERSVSAREQPCECVVDFSSVDGEAVGLGALNELVAQVCVESPSSTSAAVGPVA